jgi:quinoprotein dehydrogenase-associated probable ABC transporter substrate-binding protein
LLIKFISLSLLVFSFLNSSYAEIKPDWGVLSVCADPNSMPLSNIKQEGLENKLAEVFANDLGWSLRFEWFPQRLAFFRNTIRSKDSSSPSGFKCDVAMGASPDPEGATATKPYYKSTWVVVLPDTKIFEQVNSSNEFSKLENNVLKKLKFGVFARSPGADWVVANGLTKQMVPFVHMQSDPNDYPGMIIEKSLAEGDIDVAFAWGPIAAYSASRVKTRKLKLVPLIAPKGSRTDYSISMAVRYREPVWKNMVEKFLVERKVEIQALISQYNIPQVLEDGSVLIGNKKFVRTKE